MKKRKYRIIEDPLYGFKRLDPIPDNGELAEFYQNQYYPSILKGQRGENIRKLLAGGEETEKEVSWLCSASYKDILMILEQHLNMHPKRLLDLGCGTGDLIAFMQKNGWEVVGLELSPDAVAIARSKELEVYNLSINDFLKTHPDYLSTFSVVSLMAVLEHAPDPVEVLHIARKSLANYGMILISVPNDFSELQLSAQKRLQKDPWWIATPDHINYFSFQSLSALLERSGFEVIYSQSDFPMELFLLMGEDYVGNPEVGSKCHQKRVQFELAIPDELRRRIYQALAEVGVGRSCLILAKVIGS